MIVLNGTAQKIQAFMGEAATTTNPSFFVTYMDVGTDPSSADNADGALNGTANVNLVAGVTPNKRLVKVIQICNVDTVIHNITVQYSDGVNDRVFTKAVEVPVDKTLVWTAELGWVINPSTEVFGVLTVDGASDANLIVDKNGVSDNAKLFFKTNASTRAELGLAGNDDLTFRVSADGSAFTDAFFIDKDNGNVGIGAASSGDKLELSVSDAGAVNVARFENTNTGTGAQARFSLQRGGDAGTGVTRGCVIFAAGTVLGFADYEGRDINFWTNPTAGLTTRRMDVMADGSVVIGSPTGGAKGAGTLNASAVYDDNVLLTDLVLDYFLDGKFDKRKYEGHPIAAEETLPHWFDPDWYADFWKKNRRLPGMISWDDEKNRPSNGEVITRLTAVVETLAAHIELQNSRIKKLEA